MDAGLRWQELRTCDCCDKVLFTKKQERIFAIFEVGVAPDEVVRTLKAIATETENRLADPSRNQVDTFLSTREKTNFWSCMTDSTFAFDYFKGPPLENGGWTKISRLGDVLLGFFADEDVTFTTTYTHRCDDTHRLDLERRDITLKKGQFVYAFQGRFSLPLITIQHDQPSINTDKVTMVYVNIFNSVRKYLATSPIIFPGTGVGIQDGLVKNANDITIKEYKASALLYMHPFRPPYTLANAVRLIQTEWRKCISDPSRSICKRRLLREFKDVAEEL
jgi:hypothetical protein